MLGKDEKFNQQEFFGFVFPQVNHNFMYMCLHMYLYLVLTSSGFKRYRSLITSVDGITTSALFY